MKFPEQPPTEQDQESYEIPKARYNPNESLTLAGPVKQSGFHCYPPETLCVVARDCNSASSLLQQRTMV